MASVENIRSRKKDQGDIGALPSCSLHRLFTDGCETCEALVDAFRTGQDNDQLRQELGRLRRRWDQLIVQLVEAVGELEKKADRFRSDADAEMDKLSSGSQDDDQRAKPSIVHPTAPLQVAAELCLHQAISLRQMLETTDDEASQGDDRSC